jgi:lipid-binding SYLF domain-containing protein
VQYPLRDRRASIFDTLDYEGCTAVTATTRLLPFVTALFLLVGIARADDFTDTISLFRNAGQSGTFFQKSYAYAIFPTIGEAGFIVGGAGGKGRVYERGKYVGDTTMAQVSVGFQAGGKAFSEIIFFEDKRSLDEFRTGQFAFSAGVSAIALTAGASASAGTTGATSGISGGKKDADTASAGYQKGVIVFTIAKGGLMYTATVAGQKFSYTPL